MKINNRPLLVTAVAFLLVSAARLEANSVLDWNAIAAQTITAPPGRPGPSGIIDFAVVHATIHDAVQAYEGKYEPYATEILGAEGSVDAAIGKAARDILVNRFPVHEASVHAAYLSYLAAKGLTENDPGVDVGAAAAAGMIELRKDDGSFPSNPEIITGAELAGVWRPTPPAFAPMAAPWMGTMEPFSLKSPDQFRPGPPPPLKSQRYAREYNEVKALGSATDSKRTPEQTLLAFFWADSILLQNRIVRGVAETYLNDTGDTARLFALAWLTGADGAIAVWDSKLEYQFWRPETAIHEGDNDGNRRTVGDPGWKPFLVTPPYSDWVSGANGLTSGMLKALQLFFGTDHVLFTVTSLNPNASPNSRTFNRFSDAAKEVVDVRVYHGIHFRSADVKGRKLGLRVATWVYEHELRPLRKEQHHDHNDRHEKDDHEDKDHHDDDDDDYDWNDGD